MQVELFPSTARKKKSQFKLENTYRNTSTQLSVPTTKALIDKNKYYFLFAAQRSLLETGRPNQTTLQESSSLRDVKRKVRFVVEGDLVPPAVDRVHAIRGD
jgi:hypothetical protein